MTEPRTKPPCWTTELSRHPFIDPPSLAGITGRDVFSVVNDLEALVDDGLAGRVKHGTPHLPETFRYHLTPRGIAVASAALGCDSPDEYVRKYPMSRGWLRILIERMDAVAGIYALAAAMSPDAGGTQVEFYRKGTLDAVITLRDGRTFGVMRRGRALRPRSWRDRVMHHWLREQSTDGLLVLVPSPWEILMVLRWGESHVLPFGHIAAESAGALTDPDSRAWQDIETGTGRLTTLRKIVAETCASGITPAASPARSRASLPDPALMALEAPTFGMSRHEKVAFYIITAHPMILRKHLLAWLDVSDGWLTQIMNRLQDVWGLVERHGPRRAYRYTLSLDGIRYIAYRDRAELPTTRGIWSTAPLAVPRRGRRHEGHLMDTWAARTAHTDGITWWLSRLVAETRRSPGSALLWWAPEAWSTRPFHWNEHAIAPDAVGELVTDGRHLHFFLEYERRARNPSGIAPRLERYQEYYASDDTLRDLPGFPLCLFVVDTERVAGTYVATARAYRLLRLPILVSSIPELETAGILGRAWRPLWEPDSPRMTLAEAAGYSWYRHDGRMERRR